MSMKDWEKRVLAERGASDRVAEIENELGRAMTHEAANRNISGGSLKRRRSSVVEKSESHPSEAG
jgi:hypothetical protein